MSRFLHEYSIIPRFYETISEEIQIYDSFTKHKLAAFGQSKCTRKVSVERGFRDSLFHTLENSRTNLCAKMAATMFVLIIINKILFTL